MTEKAFKLIRGGLNKTITAGEVRIAAITRATLPGSAQIMVFEEDTNMILTVERTMRYEEEHPIRTMTDIYNAENYAPGSLVLNGRSWYALVIDLDAVDICRKAWIQNAYREIGKKLEENRITEAGVHLLGSIHGKIPAAKAFELFSEGLGTHLPSSLKKLWLVVKEEQAVEVRERMHKTFSDYR